VRERIPILSVLLNNFSMAMELPIMPVSTESIARPTFLETMPRWRARSGVTASVSQNQLKIVPAIRRGIEQTKKASPHCWIHHLEGINRLKAILLKK